MEINEGKKMDMDNLEETSSSDLSELEPKQEKIELNTPVVPTAEEQEEVSIQSDEPVQDAQVENVDEQVELVQEEPVQNQSVEENGVTDSPALKTFTQSQVNEMMGNCRTETREKTYRYIYDRYGVNSEEELDELIGNAQRFDSLREQYDQDKENWKQTSSARDKELSDIKEQVALLQSGIDNSRYEDAKFILRGKGLEVNAENIQKELATHPEWRKDAKTSMDEPNPNFIKKSEGEMPPKKPVSKITVLGNGNDAQNSANEEEDYVLNKMFHV